MSGLFLDLLKTTKQLGPLIPQLESPFETETEMVYVTRARGKHLSTSEAEGSETYTSRKRHKSDRVTDIALQDRELEVKVETFDSDLNNASDYGDDDDDFKDTTEDLEGYEDVISGDNSDDVLHKIDGTVMRVKKSKVGIVEFFRSSSIAVVLR